MLADPNMPSDDDYSFVSFSDMLTQGYNIVTINHAFAPEYLYPIQTYQVSQAMNFLLEYGKDYGLDMNNIVVSGGSSGGFVAASFVTAQVNTDYAKEIQLSPVLKKEQIKAMILESAPLDPSRAGKTQKADLTNDYVFQMALGAFTGTSAVSADKEKLGESNLISFANGDFPPTFLSDGNTGTWPDQSREYADILQSLGVDTEVYIPGFDMGVQLHAFMGAVNEEASKIFFDKRRVFLSQRK